MTKDKNKFDNILRFVPEMEFKPTNAKDKISYDKKELVLWSKNNSINKQDLSGFKFLVHLIDDSTGKEYVQEVNFVNGYINGNTKMEFEINID